MDFSGPEPPSTAAAPLRLFGLGHSHLVSLQHAAGAHPAAPGRADFRFLLLLDRQFHPNIIAALPTPLLHPALLAEIGDVLADGSVRLLFAAVSGNEYHALAMVNHPRRFDFVLQERRDMPLQRDAEIIPAPLVEAALLKLMQAPAHTLNALRRLTDLPIVAIGSPPPIPDDAFVARQDTMFSEAIRRHGVSPAALRWKLWQVQTRLFRRFCAENNIDFLPPPAETMDADGYMVEQGWHPDSVHGNIWYGGRVLLQLEEYARTTPRAAA